MLHSSSQNTLWTRVQFSNIYPLNLFAIWVISGILWLIFNLNGSDRNRLLNVYVIEYTNVHIGINKLNSFLFLRFLLTQNTSSQRLSFFPSSNLYSGSFAHFLSFFRSSPWEPFHRIMKRDTELEYFCGYRRAALTKLGDFYDLGLSRTNDVKMSNLQCLSEFVIFLILMTKDRQTLHFNDKSQTKVRNSLMLISVCLSEFRVYI